MNRISPYNEMKIFKHTDKLRDLEENRITGPIFLRVKPTNVCIHNCFYCNYHASDNKRQKIKFHNKEFINWKLFRQAIIDFVDMGGKSITFSGGGEPLIYYKILDAIELSKDLGLDIAIITNGQELKDEKAEMLYDANWVRISSDSHNKEMFNKIRRIDEYKFLELENNIKHFISSKDSNCQVGINCVVSEFNAPYIFDIAKYMKNLGVNHIKFAALIKKDTEEYHQPFRSIVTSQIKDSIRRLTDETFKIYDKYSNHFDYSAKHFRTYDRCIIMQIGAVIGADSGIYLCHDKAYDNLGLLGNLKEKSFKEVWFSKETEEFFNTFNPIEKCKHHCMYDSRNILLNDYLNIDIDNVNFI